MPLSFVEALMGVLQALVALVWVGLAVTFWRQLYVASREQWDHVRSPDGYFPGVLDADRGRRIPDIGGAGPTLFAMVGGVVMGMCFYSAGSFVVLFSGAGFILVSGMPIDFLPSLYMVGGLSVIVGWTFWIEIERTIRSSDVYLGWY